MSDTTHGDNKPPLEFELPTIDEIVAMLEVNYSDVVARTNEIVAKGERFYVIQTDEEEADATQFLNSVSANKDTGEAGRVKEKGIYDERAGAAHAWFRTNIIDRVAKGPANPHEPFNPIERTDLGVGPRISRALKLYKGAKLEVERKRRAEEQRIALAAEAKARAEAAAAEAAALEAQRAANRKRNEEQREKAQALLEESQRVAEAARLAADKAAEERAKADEAAAVKAADLTRARGGRGGLSALSEFVNYRDLQRDILDLGALRPYFTDKALESAVAAYAKANRATITRALGESTQPVSGISFFIDHGLSRRK